MIKKVIFNWSGGKDSALALYEFGKNPNYKVVELLTNVAQNINRVSAHGVSAALMQKQAEAIGIPLHLLMLPENTDMEEYNRITENRYNHYKSQDITDTVFGDILLEDLKAYREGHLQPLGFNLHFPLWKRNTKQVVLDFIDVGFKAVVVAVNAQVLDKSFVGREVNLQFIDDLPGNVDPCGENGEYHTFVYDGPLFSYGLSLQKGELIYREYKAPRQNDSGCTLTDETNPKKMDFWFLDLVVS